MLNALDDDVLLAAHLYLSHERIVSSREVYNLTNYFGDLGGTFGLLLIVIETLAGFFSRKLAMVKKAENLFKVSEHEPFIKDNSAAFAKYQKPPKDRDARLDYLSSLAPLHVTLL